MTAAGKRSLRGAAEKEAFARQVGSGAAGKEAFARQVGSRATEREAFARQIESGAVGERREYAKNI